jgi:8-oxo-dGTP pyrophosphatase MutT (NUDIX family)
MQKVPLPETTAYDGGQLFRIRHVEQPGRPNGLPYEFVDRVGAVVILPLTMIDDEPHVVAIQNTRAYYGASYGLPSGNRDGRFDAPEPIAAAGLRELQEETGYGYAAVSSMDIHVFNLRALSNTIRYQRSFMVARNVQPIGGMQDNPREKVVPQLVPLATYMEPFFEGNRGELYPEINVAFMRAGLVAGRQAVLEWTQTGQPSDVATLFEPWLQPTTDATV